MCSAIYGALGDIVKQTVNRDAVDNIICSSDDMPTESSKFAQSIVGCLMKMPTITAPITKLVEIHAETAFMNEEKCYHTSTFVEKENEEATPQLPLMGRSPTLSCASKHDKRSKCRKWEALHSSRSSCKKKGSIRFTSEDYQVDCPNNSAKDVNMLRLLNAHSTE